MKKVIIILLILVLIGQFFYHYEDEEVECNGVFIQICGTNNEDYYEREVR